MKVEAERRCWAMQRRNIQLNYGRWLPWSIECTRDLCIIAIKVIWTVSTVITSRGAECADAVTLGWITLRDEKNRCNRIR